ncbi:MAG: N-methyl-L-tryptophan oxidase [Planctomycetes bacterium]|nr:N-methyl-L-tryptophan oxidase [Planctomycetota bacterium]
MSDRFDVIVVGVGTMGSATAYQLARRGLRVLGLEQFDIPHTRGAGHGFSRVIRMAYWEHIDYVPLLRRAYEAWREIEADSGQAIMHITGGVYYGRPDSELITGSLRAQREHNIAHEQLSHRQLEERYPMFRTPKDYVGMYEDAVGFIVPEQSIASYCIGALSRGAELHGHEPVLSWSSTAEGVTVRTAKAEYSARKLVFSGGAWSDRLITDLGVKLVVSRQVLGWVWPKRPEIFQYGKLPVWMMDHGTGGVHYGFPMMPNVPGFKLAYHKVADAVNPDRVNRDPMPGDEETFRPLLRKMIPDADGPTLAIRTCLYTNSPDGHFILDTHPRHPNVAIACGFSGHGFKFASVIGEIMADLAMHGRTDLPIGFLGLNRFGLK